MESGLVIISFHLVAFNRAFEQSELYFIFLAINASARAYISKVTTVRERTHHTALFSLFQTLGFVIGPAVQAALTPIGDSEIDAESTVVFNMYTATG